MKNYCQKTEPWGSQKISGNIKMSQCGCLITSIACIDGRTPGKVLSILKANGAITDASLVLWEKAAKALGMNFDGFSNNPSPQTLIAQTDHYLFKYGFVHFFVYLNDGNIIDPLDGIKKPNPYRITRYAKFYPEDVKKKKS